MKRRTFIIRSLAVVGSAFLATVRQKMAQADGRDPDAVAYWGSYATSLTNGRKALDNQLFVDLKEAGYFDRLDFLYVLAHEVMGLALRNLVKRDHDCTMEGAVAFTANQGMRSTGGYLDTHYNPATDGVNYQQANASLGLYCLDLPVEDGMMMGAINFNPGYRAYIERLADASVSYGLNNGGPNFVTDGIGLYAPDRNGNSLQLYQNGVAVAADSFLPGNLYPLNLYLLNINIGGSPSETPTTAEVAVAWAGGSFAAAEHADLADIFGNYLDAM